MSQEELEPLFNNESNEYVATLRTMMETHKEANCLTGAKIIKNHRKLKLCYNIVQMLFKKAGKHNVYYFPLEVSEKGSA